MTLFDKLIAASRSLMEYPPPTSMFARPFAMVMPENSTWPAVEIHIKKTPWTLLLPERSLTGVAPGPLNDILEVIPGRALPKLIVPAMPLRTIELDAAATSQLHTRRQRHLKQCRALAAVIASRTGVHKPSPLFAASEVLLTVIVLPRGWAGSRSKRRGDDLRSQR